VSPSGNVIVTGEALETANNHSAYATVAYSSDGLLLWTNIYKRSLNSDDRARAVAIDQRGYVFVTGVSTEGGNNHCATVLYSPSGLALWTNLCGLANDLNEPRTAQSLAIASDGAVILGWSEGDSAIQGYGDYALVKYLTSAILSVTRTNDTLLLSWPTGFTGWRLEVQTNSVRSAQDARWLTVPGSDSTNWVNVEGALENGSSFFRLAYP
jgi:hypothetical protein